MKNYEANFRLTPWLMASALSAVLAACGGGGQSPILGAGDIALVVPPVVVVAPTVTLVTPSVGALNVATNTKTITATFSKAMDLATLTNASFTLACPVGTPISGTVGYLADSRIVALTLPLATDLPKATCTATVTTAAKDSTGLALANNFQWQFTTVDVKDQTAPTVTATDVALNTRVGATFSEALNPLSVNNTSFTLKQTSNGATVAGVTSYSGVNAAFIPSAPLAAGSNYTATVKSGAAGVTDLAGNPLAADYVWTWTAVAGGDTTPPTIGVLNPAASATSVCTNKTINASFSEPMDPLTLNNATFTVKLTAGGPIAGLVTYDATTKIASFKPNSSLVAGNYTATLTGGANGVKDLSGNALTADKVWTFDVTVATCVLAPSLGTASSFGGFGGNATLTNDGLNTIINGNIGVNASSTKITGLHDAGGNVYTITTSNNGSVNGSIFTLTAPPGSVAGAAVTQARIDTLAAFNAISPAILPGGLDVSSLAQCPSCGGAGGGADELGGRTLPPGVYRSTTGTYDIGGATRTVANLTLDAGGDTNAVWVFQTSALSGTLNVGLTGPATPAVPIQVLLLNGAQAKNVFWYVPGGATIGTGSTMVGTLLADATISLSTTGGTPPTAVLTTLNGRALALTAGVTMTNTVVNVPAQ